MIRREPRRARVVADHVHPHRAGIGDEESQQAATARERADCLALRRIDSRCDELRERRALLVEHSERGVPRGENLACRHDEAVEDVVEVELGRQHHAGLDESFADRPSLASRQHAKPQRPDRPDRLERRNVRCSADPEGDRQPPHRADLAERRRDTRREVSPPLPGGPVPNPRAGVEMRDETRHSVCTERRVGRVGGLHLPLTRGVAGEHETVGPPRDAAGRGGDRTGGRGMIEHAGELHGERGQRCAHRRAAVRRSSSFVPPTMLRALGSGPGRR